MHRDALSVQLPLNELQQQLKLPPEILERYLLDEIYQRCKSLDDVAARVRELYPEHDLVLWRGPTDSPKVALVGEAPGGDEVAWKKCPKCYHEGIESRCTKCATKREAWPTPFVGASGHHLNKIITEAGLRRQDCFAFNVLPIRPPENKLPRLHELGLTVGEFHPLLKRVLELVKPNIVCAIGGTTLAVLCAKQGITKWRGSILESTLIPKLKVVPTIHTAMLFQEWSFRPRMVFDLSRVKEEQETPLLLLPVRKYILEPTFEQAINELRRLQRSPSVQFDIELLFRDIACIGFSDSATESICIPFRRGDGSFYWSPIAEAAIVQEIARILQNPNILKINQNIMFDILWIYSRFGVWTVGPFMDTMLLHHTLWVELPHGLAFIGTAYTREPYYKDDGRAWKPAMGDRKLWTYNCKDNTVTTEASQDMLAEAMELGLYDFYNEHVMPRFEPCRTMQVIGVKINRAAAVERAHLCRKEAEQIQVKLNALLGMEINVDSPKQLAELFYTHLNFDPIYSRKSQRVTTDEAAREKLYEKYQHPSLKLIDAIKKKNHIRSTYYEARFDPDSRLRSSWNISGTETGRFSASSNAFGTGTNLQNFPEEAREIIIPDAGCWFISPDLAQAESRIVAALSEDDEALELYRKFDETGEKQYDIHRITYSIIFPGVTPENTTSKQRYIGKRTRHAGHYDMQALKLAEVAGITPEAAEVALIRFHQANPKIRQIFQRNVREKLNKTRTMTNIFGRKRVFFDRFTGHTFREGYAWEPQSTVSDINKMGMVKIYNRNLPHLLLLQEGHDSTLWEYDPSKIRMLDLIKIMRKDLSIPIVINGYHMTIPVEIKIGINWKNLFEIR